jgi:hypothetical protein
VLPVILEEVPLLSSEYTDINRRLDTPSINNSCSLIGYEQSAIVFEANPATIKELVNMRGQ